MVTSWGLLLQAVAPHRVESPAIGHTLLGLNSWPVPSSGIGYGRNIHFSLLERKGI